MRLRHSPSGASVTATAETCVWRGAFSACLGPAMSLCGSTVGRRPRHSHPQAENKEGDVEALHPWGTQGTREAKAWQGVGEGGGGCGCPGPRVPHCGAPSRHSASSRC